MGARCQTVLDRIVMNVITVPFVVLVISNGMLPKPTLPYSATTIPTT